MIAILFSIPAASSERTYIARILMILASFENWHSQLSNGANIIVNWPILPSSFFEIRLFCWV